MGDREEGEGSSRKLVESQGGKVREGERAKEMVRFSSKNKERSNLELDVDLT